MGIITPYKEQMKLLRKQLGGAVEVNTVDAFQGREKDIIIISCVRGGGSGGLGFLNDYRRMNVAVTRAKHVLWVVGNRNRLEKNGDWRAYIRWIEERGWVKRVEAKMSERVGEMVRVNGNNKGEETKERRKERFKRERENYEEEEKKGRKVKRICTEEEKRRD